MNESHWFLPPRTGSIIFNLAIILILAAAGLYGVWNANQAQVGPTFLLDLLLILLALILIPLLVYRFITLRGTAYILERDGIRLRWGLRIEDIPMNRVLWVRTSDDLQERIPLPWLRWPGNVVGTRRLPDGSILEFLSVRSRHLVLIAIPGRIFVISPADLEEFLRTYQRLMELGSLSPLPARSLYPSFLLARFWSDRLARVLLLVGLGINLVLLAIVSFAIPNRQQLSLHLLPGNTSQELVASVQLLLLPLLSAGFYLADFLFGLFLYRRSETSPPGPGSTNAFIYSLGSSGRGEQGQVMAYLLWGCGILAPILFLVAVIFILYTHPV